MTKALQALPRGSIARGIYWIGDRVPDSELGVWLRRRENTFWVRHLDFDELMAVVKDVFDLPHPQGDRFDSLLKRYQDTFSTLQGDVDADDTTPEVVRESIDSAREKFDSWFAVHAEARRHKETDPDRADQIYRDGLEAFPSSFELLTNYAVFLRRDRNDADGAEMYLRRSLAVDARQSKTLANLAGLLADVRHDYDGAEAMFRQALELTPRNAPIVGNYANFLTQVRRRHDDAETAYRRSMEIDPTNPHTPGNLAGLLWGRGRVDEARRMANRALVNEPTKPLLIENDIYRIANDRLDEHERGEVLTHLHTLLITGERTPGWTFDLNIERAGTDGATPEELELLRALAAVATDEEPIGSLDRFPEWAALDDG